MPKGTQYIGYLLTLYNKNDLGKGIALGSQMSQWFALFYASEIDNYVYHYKNIKTYGRYMDDIYIFSKDKNTLNKLLVNIRKIAIKNKIIINEKKTKIIKVSKGITYLKRKYYLTTSNRIIERINPDAIYRLKRKMKKGVLNKNDFKAWFNSYKNLDCRLKLLEIRKDITL